MAAKAVGDRRECSVYWTQSPKNVWRLPGNAATRAYSRTGSCRCHEDGRLRLYASDCLSRALCLECTRPTADSGAFMCAVRRQLAPLGRRLARLFCETWNRFTEPSTITGGETIQPFIRHQRLVLFVGRESVQPLQLVSCLLFILSLSFFPMVAACGASHMTAVRSRCIEMDSFCGGVQHKVTQNNVNVLGKHDFDPPTE